MLDDSLQQGDLVSPMQVTLPVELAAAVNAELPHELTDGLVPGLPDLIRGGLLISVGLPARLLRFLSLA